MSKQLKIQLALRGDGDMEKSLRKSAAEHGWSLSEEIRTRLWFSFSEEPTKGQLMAAPNRVLVKQRYEAAWRDQPVSAMPANYAEADHEVGHD